MMWVGLRERLHYSRVVKTDGRTAESVCRVGAAQCRTLGKQQTGQLVAGAACFEMEILGVWTNETFNLKIFFD